MRVAFLRPGLFAVAILLAIAVGYLLGSARDEPPIGSPTLESAGPRLQLDTSRVTLLPASSLAVDPQLLRPPEAGVAPPARSTSEP